MISKQNAVDRESQIVNLLAIPASVQRVLPPADIVDPTSMVLIAKWSPYTASAADSVSSRKPQYLYEYDLDILTCVDTAQNALSYGGKSQTEADNLRRMEQWKLRNVSYPCKISSDKPIVNSNCFVDYLASPASSRTEQLFRPPLENLKDGYTFMSQRRDVFEFHVDQKWDLKDNRLRFSETKCGCHFVRLEVYIPPYWRHQYINHGISIKSSFNGVPAAIGCELQSCSVSGSDTVLWNSGTPIGGIPPPSTTGVACECIPSARMMPTSSSSSVNTVFTPPDLLYSAATCRSMKINWSAMKAKMEGREKALVDKHSSFFKDNFYTVNAKNMHLLQNVPADGIGFLDTIHSVESKENADLDPMEDIPKVAKGQSFWLYRFTVKMKARQGLRETWGSRMDEKQIKELNKNLIRDLPDDPDLWLLLENKNLLWELYKNHPYYTDPVMRWSQLRLIQTSNHTCVFVVPFEIMQQVYKIQKARYDPERHVLDLSHPFGLRIKLHFPKVENEEEVEKQMKPGAMYHLKMTLQASLERYNHCATQNCNHAIVNKSSSSSSSSSS